MGNICNKIAECLRFNKKKNSIENKKINLNEKKINFYNDFNSLLNIKDIEILYINKKYNDCLNECIKYIKLYKNDIDILILLLKCYFIKKEYQLSEKTILDIEKIDKNIFEVNDIKAKLIYKKFFDEENMDLLDMVINIYNDSLSNNITDEEKYNAISNINLVRKLKYLKNLEKKDLKKTKLIDYFEKRIKNFDIYKKYFANTLESDSSIQVPGLSCNMTLELMSEPICLQSGYSYEEKMIKGYYKNSPKANKDPSTNKLLKNMKLFKNTILKKAVKYHIKENPYTLDSLDENDWRKISLI